MLVKMIRDEDYSSYREVSMLIAFPYCNFKCCTELRRSIAMCQNSPVAQLSSVDISPDDIYEKYARNVITHSVVCGGLEPMESFNDLLSVLHVFRKKFCCMDPFIIYTGFYEHEISWQIGQLSEYPNIIVKFGRFIPGQQSHFDELLGVTLASPNQYAKKIS